MKTQRLLNKACIRILICMLFILLINVRKANAQASSLDSLKQMLNSFQKNILDSSIQQTVQEVQMLMQNDSISDTLARKLLVLEKALFKTKEPDKKMVLCYSLLLGGLLQQSQQKNRALIVESIDNLADGYIIMGLYEKALPLYQQSLSINKKIFGEEDSNYAASLNNLASLYEKMGEYEKALPLHEQALTIRKRVLGEEHLDYATTLNNLAILYFDRGEYKKALLLIQQALIIRKKMLGEAHPDYAESLNNLGLLYRYMGQFEKAFPLLEQALTIAKASGEENINYADVLDNLAHLYQNVGLYEKALSLSTKVLEIDKKYRGEEHPYFAISLNNLANLYESMGQYEKALPLYQRALAIYKRTLGENSRYVSILNNIADINEKMGQYEKALRLYQQALAIIKKSVGEEFRDYARTLNNLAGLYKRMGLYTKALPLFQQSLTITKKELGEENPSYAVYLNSLASLHTSMGQYEKALPLQQKALEIRKKVFGKDHPEYANSLNSLAGLYESIGQFTNALSLYQQALSIRRNVLGEQHPDYIESLKNIGLIYILLNKNKDAVDSIVKANKLRLQNISANISTLSEDEKIKLMTAELSKFDILPSLLITDNIRDPDIVQQLYNNELLLKGMVLQDQQDILSDIRQSADSTALQLYEQWKFNKGFIGKQLLLPKRERISYLDSLQEATTELEQTLSRRSAVFNTQEESRAITANSLIQKLSKGEAAIEFIRFRMFNKKWTDSTMYAALLIRPDDSVVRFIPLFEEKKLKHLLTSRGFEHVDITTSTVYRGISNNSDALSNDSLYLLVWKPLVKYLTDINTIYYAPVGLLHRMAFQSLKADIGYSLIDKYQLNEVLSTRSVVLQAKENIKPVSANIWGNIQYNLAHDYKNFPHDQTDTAVSAFNYYTADTRGIHSKEWDSLPGATQEINSLRVIFQHAGINVTTNSGTIATEEQFKTLDGKSAQVLHLSTHGFFLPMADNKPQDASNTVLNQNTFTAQQNPMFRSGLVLAGANYAWKGNPALLGKEDGILTAYEIAQMDLSNTDLIVLSACETALGDIEGNEGVIGLQRALKLAGVKQIIMSLWRVPDNETRELMTMFYTNWLNGESPRGALRSAQLKMKEKYSTYYYWAAFVLVE